MGVLRYAATGTFTTELNTTDDSKEDKRDGREVIRTTRDAGASFGRSTCLTEGDWLESGIIRECGLVSCRGVRSYDARKFINVV